MLSEPTSSLFNLAIQSEDRWPSPIDDGVEAMMEVKFPYYYPKNIDIEGEITQAGMVWQGYCWHVPAA